LTLRINPLGWGQRKVKRLDTFIEREKLEQRVNAQGGAQGA